jgi:hypothetical protein
VVAGLCADGGGGVGVVAGQGDGVQRIGLGAAGSMAGGGGLILSRGQGRATHA